VKRYSFATSHLTAPDALAPTIHLGDTVLTRGETVYKLPVNTDSTELVLTELSIRTSQVLDACGLGRTSVLAIVADLECPGFDLKTTVFRRTLDLRAKSATFSDESICSIPAPIVSEGFSIRLNLVAVSPVVTSPAGCTTSGGILSTWESTIPPKNWVSPFPTEESPNEPAIWRLQIDVDDPDDLDRPLRAAMRLHVDSSRLDNLFGSSAADSTHQQATSWITAEMFTAIVMHVLSNQELRTHLTAWLSRVPPIEKDLDVRSIGYFLVVMLRNITGPHLDEWHARLIADPVGTTREIRVKIDQVRTGRRSARAQIDARR
jgi:hypothetical protein